MKVKIAAIKVVGLHRVFLGHADAITRRVQRGQPLGVITINGNFELIDGADALHAARRLRLDEVEVVVIEGP